MFDESAAEREEQRWAASLSRSSHKPYETSEPMSFAEQKGRSSVRPPSDGGLLSSSYDELEELERQSLEDDSNLLLLEQQVNEHIRQAELEQLRIQQEQEEREREEQRLRAERERQKQQQASAANRRWDTEIKTNVTKLNVQLQRLSSEPFTTNLAMDYVNSIKEMNSTLELVFPLVCENDKRTIGAMMKTVVLDSSNLVKTARDRANGVRSADVLFAQLRDVIHANLVSLIRKIAEAVRNQTHKKSVTNRREQIVQNVREAAIIGVRAGELIQLSPFPIIELSRVINSMLQKVRSAADLVQDPSIAARLRDTSSALQQQIFTLQKNGHQLTSATELQAKAALIEGISDIVAVLQVLQTSQFY